MLLSTVKHDGTWEPAINGRDISQYEINFSNNYVKRSSELHTSLDQSIVSNPKIYFQRMRKISLFPRIVAAYDNGGMHGLYTCSVIFPKNGIDISLKYILGLLNSKLINVWYKNYDTDIEIKLVSMKNIPIPDISLSNQSELSSMVDKLMESKKEKNRDKTSELLILIDKIVCDIYGLTDEERRVIENI